MNVVRGVKLIGFVETISPGFSPRVSPTVMRIPELRDKVVNRQPVTSFLSSGALRHCTDQFEGAGFDHFACSSGVQVEGLCLLVLGAHEAVLAGSRGRCSATDIKLRTCKWR